MYDHHNDTIRAEESEVPVENNTIEMKEEPIQITDVTENLQDTQNNVEDTSTFNDTSNAIVNDLKDVGAPQQEGEEISGDFSNKKSEVNNSVEENSQEIIDAKN